MTTTFDSGIELILWLQQFSPALDQLFIFFTLLGNETFFLVALPTLYWCFDRRIGARLVIDLHLLLQYLACLANAQPHV